MRKRLHVGCSRVRLDIQSDSCVKLELRASKSALRTAVERESPNDRLHMARVMRDFYQRGPSERNWMVESTWCGECRIHDLGLDDPVEYEEEGRIYVEGRCRICGEPTLAEIVDQRKTAESQ